MTSVLDYQITRFFISAFLAFAELTYSNMCASVIRLGNGFDPVFGVF